MSTLPDYPVLVHHLEDPPGSGLAACCGLVLPKLPTVAKVARYLCPLCAYPAKERQAEAVTAVLDLLAEQVRAEMALADESEQDFAALKEWGRADMARARSGGLAAVLALIEQAKEKA